MSGDKEAPSKTTTPPVEEEKEQNHELATFFARLAMKRGGSSPAR